MYDDCWSLHVVKLSHRVWQPIGLQFAAHLCPWKDLMLPEKELLYVEMSKTCIRSGAHCLH
jgi:hypothetical protein